MALIWEPCVCLPLFSMLSGSDSRMQWFFASLRFLGSFSRRVFGNWSLERKSLLFLGVALAIPIGLSFWFVLRVLADSLVMQTTRLKAREYALSEIAWVHQEPGPNAGVFPDADSAPIFTPEMASLFKRSFIGDPSYSRPEFLMVENEEEYTGFEVSFAPAENRARQLLIELNEAYREQLVKLHDAEQQVVEDAQVSSEDSVTLAQDDIEKLLSENTDVINIRNSLRILYREDGPYYPEGQELERLVSQRVIKDTPVGGWYVYYHALRFDSNCMECHRRYDKSNAPDTPFRAVRVLIPYSQTKVASNTTLAILIALAMVTISATLLVVHWVFRRIVLTPLQHLQNVSEEIGRGNIDLRASIDTGDEFNDLGDAFNRMLRNISEDQQTLRSLNAELDTKVDELAQANFNLYEANRLKSDFLANMTHELRTPLNSIIGFSEVIRGIDSLNEKQRKYADNIQSSGQVLLDMINEILDLAKIEAGKMQVSATTFAVAELVQSQCHALQPLVDEKNVDLRVEFEQPGLEVHQDRAKLQQILTNLLSNAIKFTPDGGMITVRGGVFETAGDAEVGLFDTPARETFYLEVVDTGVGIPESDFEIIFEKFRQSNEVLKNDGLTRQYAGTGLGLSIVKELCKLLGGEIKLASQLGTGSTFRVVLPTYFEANAESDTSSEVSDG